MIDIQLEGGSNNSEQKLESLDISSSLPSGQSIAINELRLNGNMETVQLDKVDEVDDLLSICINTLSSVSLCPTYTRILNASSSAYDQTSDDCPALCGSPGDITNIPAIDLSDEAAF